PSASMGPVCSSEPPSPTSTYTLSLHDALPILLRAKGDPAGLPAEERDIVTYVRQLMRTNRVDQRVFDALKNRHDTQWMVELTEVDRKSTRLNSSHVAISHAVFCLKKRK